MSSKHNPYLRLFTRDVEGSPKINSLSMAASGLYFRLLNRLNEPPMPGSLALHDWEVHHNWRRSLTQQCLACPTESGRLVYFAKYFSRIFQWKSADILKALQELFFFGIVRVEGDRLIQPRMYRDNGYAMENDAPENAEIDPATGAITRPEEMTEKITEGDDKNDDKKTSKKIGKKLAEKNLKKSTEKNRSTHARGHSNEREYENNIGDNNERNNVIDKAQTEKISKNRKQQGPTFDDFWSLYDKKCDRTKSEALWAKLSKKDREAIILYIPQYKAAQPDKQFRKNPTTFLRNRAWEDEIITDQRISPSRSRNAAAAGEAVPATAPQTGKYKKW